MQCLACDRSFEPNRKGSGGVNRDFCFDCMPEGLTRRERNKKRQDLLTHLARLDKVALGCSTCGYNTNPSALEWHHPNKDKEANPTNAIKRGWKAYLAEIDSCSLLCANCHREVHYEWP